MNRKRTPRRSEQALLEAEAHAERLAVGRDRREWRYSFPYLPPSINGAYFGNHHLKPEVAGLMESMAMEALLAGFRSKPGVRYRWRLVFVVAPSTGRRKWDASNLVKLWEDATFGSANDDMVIHGEFAKVLHPAIPPSPKGSRQKRGHTFVTIWRVALGDEWKLTEEEERALLAAHRAQEASEP